MSLARYFFLACVFFTSISPAQDSKIKVGVFLDSSPFSFREKDGTYSGAAVDLFSYIAKDLQWNYELIPIDSIFDEAIEKVHHGDIDILIGPISINHERYQKVDFSLPYFLNSIGIAVRKPGEANLFEIIVENVKDKVSYLLPIIGTLFIFVMICLYLIDNQPHPLKGKKSFISKLSGAFWETLMVLIQGHSVNLKEVHAILKRLVLIFWLLPSLVFFSIIIGSIVSTLTVLENNKSHLFMMQKEELDGKTLSVLKGNVAIEEGRKLGAIMIPVSSRKEALDMVVSGKVFGTTDDYITLEKSLQTLDDTPITMSNLNLRNDELAFVFKKGSHLIRIFNQKLLYLQDQGFSENICARHLGHKANLCIL